MFDPKPEGERRSSWRTFPKDSAGPQPGDAYSIEGVDGAEKGQLEHVGFFRSRRPGAEPNTEIWTVVDGGQGQYDAEDKILERTRLFHKDTNILTSKLADGGQSAGRRLLRGWIDIEAHFKFREPEKKK